MSTYGNLLSEYSPQMEFAGFEETPREGILSHSQEMELASEFLDVENEQELEQFLGDLIGHVGHALGKIVKSPIGKAIGGVLKKVAKTALPIAGGALGGFVGGPIGAMIGSNLASMAGGALGLELEGLSAEDREFEATRQFIRFAGQTIANALDSGEYGDPAAVAHRAAVESARVYAPGLMDIDSFAGNFNHHEKDKGRYDMNHDIDRTQAGFSHEGGRYFPRRGGTVFNEEEHANLAASLMEVNSEQELEYFLGDVISGAASAVGKFINSPTGQALGSGLKDVAKQLLPVAGQALGTYVGGGTGGQIGGALGSAAAGMFEMESGEQEWEAASTFVKLAGEAAKNVAEMPPGDPATVAKTAIIEAAKVHAPHIVPILTGMAHGHHPGHHPGQGGCGHHHHHPSGQWYRHGKRIVLVGV
jgi:uncharacterized protein (DUF697 family)